jgi:hypothetical protein
MNDNDNTEFFDKAKKSNRTNLILCLVIIVGVTLYYAFSSGGSTTFDIGETAIIISGSEESGFSVTINYEDITKISLLTSDEFDVGTMITGYDGKKEFYGTWESSTIGQYNVYANAKVKEYVVIETDNDIPFVMNYESSDTTTSFYNALLDLLDESGYTYETYSGVAA